MTVLAILKAFAAIRAGLLARQEDNKVENSAYYVPKFESP